MKALLVLLLISAGASLAWIGWRASDPDHQAHTLEGGADPTYVPAVLIGELPDGAHLIDFIVDGPCCDGCSQSLYKVALAVQGVQAAAIHYDGDRGLAVGQVWMGASGDSDSLLGALTFQKYRARVGGLRRSSGQR